jgi:hypothetical protein
VVTITSTFSRANSIANSGRRSYLPSAFSGIPRGLFFAFRIAVLSQSFFKLLQMRLIAAAMKRMPIRGILDCA